MAEPFEPFEPFDGAYWEHRYRSHPGAHIRKPSPHLVRVAGELGSGTVLEVGCGEGADAVWLAEAGWEVTALDVAATAVHRAREYAGQRGAELAERITWVDADVTDWRPPRSFDLVTAHYVHPSGGWPVLLRVLADAVAPGGTLLVVGHGPEDDATTLAGGQVTLEVRAAANGLDPAIWEVLAAELRTRTVAHGADGHAAGSHGVGRTLHDAVLHARRR